MTVGLFLPPVLLAACLAAGAFTLALGCLSWFARALNRRRDPRPGYLPLSRFDQEPEFTPDWRRDDLAVRRLWRDIHRAGDRP